MTKNHDRVNRFADAIIAQHGVTDEAIRKAAEKFVEQAELREALEGELQFYMGANIER